MVIIIGGVIVVAVAVVAVAIIMAPGKGSGENPEKSFPRRKGGVLLGLLIRKGARVGVIDIPFNASPA